MKRLTLIRHAKALPAAANQDDASRALSPKGRIMAQQMGQELAELKPDLALCSPALRTKETLALISAEWEPGLSIDYDETLYLAHASVLLRRIMAVPDAAASVWLIGHNPGLHDLVRQIAAWTEGHASRTVFFDHFPTGAHAKFSFETDHWSDLDRSACRYEHSASSE